MLGGQPGDPMLQDATDGVERSEHEDSISRLCSDLIRKPASPPPATSKGYLFRGPLRRHLPSAITAAWRPSGARNRAGNRPIASESAPRNA